MKKQQITFLACWVLRGVVASTTAMADLEGDRLKEVVRRAAASVAVVCETDVLHRPVRPVRVIQAVMMNESPRVRIHLDTTVMRGEMHHVEKESSRYMDHRNLGVEDVGVGVVVDVLPHGESWASSGRPLTQPECLMGLIGARSRSGGNQWLLEPPGESMNPAMASLSHLPAPGDHVVGVGKVPILGDPDRQAALEVFGVQATVTGVGEVCGLVWISLGLSGGVGGSAVSVSGRPLDGLPFFNERGELVGIHPAQRHGRGEKMGPLISVMSLWPHVEVAIEREALSLKHDDREQDLEREFTGMRRTLLKDHVWPTPEIWTRYREGLEEAVRRGVWPSDWLSKESEVKLKKDLEDSSSHASHQMVQFKYHLCLHDANTAEGFVRLAKESFGLDPLGTREEFDPKRWRMGGLFEKITNEGFVAKYDSPRKGFVVERPLPEHRCPDCDVGIPFIHELTDEDYRELRSRILRGNLIHKMEDEAGDVGYVNHSPSWFTRGNPFLELWERRRRSWHRAELPLGMGLRLMTHEEREKFHRSTGAMIIQGSRPPKPDSRPLEVRTGDLLTEFGGREVVNRESVEITLYGLTPSSVVTAKVIREGQVVSVAIPLR